MKDNGCEEGKIVALVFVSYSHMDTDFVKRLVEDLRKRGVPTWLDHLNIPAGTRWDLEIEQALDKSTHLLLVLSSHSVQSQNVLDEISFARDENKTIIPILIEDCKLPLRVRRVQYTDFRTNYDQGVEHVLKQLPREAHEISTSSVTLDDADKSQEAEVISHLPPVDPAAARSAMEVASLVFYASAKSHTVALTRPTVIIGRGEYCEIEVRSRQISREHIRLTVKENHYFIEDVESRNGTWVNGSPLKGIRQLTDGDKINLAMTVYFEFLGAGSTAPAPHTAQQFTTSPIELHPRIELHQETQAVVIKGVTVDPPLSPPQYRLLELLYVQQGRVCTREQVIESVWQADEEEDVSEAAVEALVQRLRDRLDEIDPEWQYILTVRGHGFRLNS